MPASQGRIPKIVIKGKMQGFDTNHQATNDSIEYRGRPYCSANGYDQFWFDVQREQVKMSWQNGLKTIGYYLTTSRVRPIN